MKEKILNKIIKKIEERKEEHQNNSKKYENNSQTAYNSTLYSKMETRFFIGGIAQIVLTLCTAAIIKNPTFAFLKKFLNPVSATLILTPISLTIGEITRKYLSKSSIETLKELNINDKTPDYMRIANEVYYKVKSKIAEKNIKINATVIENIKTQEIKKPQISNYSALIKTNDELKIELEKATSNLENLIYEQVLCQEYKMNRTYTKELLASLKKATAVSITLSTILLSGIILIGISYYPVIPNIDLVLINLLKNYLGAITISIPGLVLYFNQDYKLKDRAMKDVVKEKPELEDCVDTVRRQDLCKKIYNEHRNKSTRELKKYFTNKIETQMNEIISLQTTIETNNISINLLREEAMQELIKKRTKERTPSIKPKKVNETRITFKGKARKRILGL